MSLHIDFHHVKSVRFSDDLVPREDGKDFAFEKITITTEDGKEQSIGLYSEAGQEHDNVVRFRIWQAEQVEVDFYGEEIDRRETERADLIEALRAAYSDIERLPGHTIDMLGRIEAALERVGAHPPASAAAAEQPTDHRPAAAQCGAWPSLYGDLAASVAP